MIEPDFEPYCDDCSDLDPVVNRVYGNNAICQQIITCEHIYHCRKVAEFYRENGNSKPEKGENNGT